MTTPIERAAAAIDENYNPDQAPILAAMFQDYARAAYEAIDTDQLATITQDAHAHWAHYEGDLDLWEYVAQAVKNWLTGKDQQ